MNLKINIFNISPISRKESPTFDAFDDDSVTGIDIVPFNALHMNTRFAVIVDPC